MSEYTTKEEISQLIKETFDVCGESDLFDCTKIQWNSRFTRRMGDARYNHFKGTGRVRFSSVLWNRATPEERRETIIHEACHVVAERHARRLGRRTAGHGPIWKRYMTQAGAKGDRCHTVNRDGLRRKVRRVPAYCDCKEWQITKTRQTKMLKGYRYGCPDCKASLSLNAAQTTRY